MGSFFQKVLPLNLPPNGESMASLLEGVAKTEGVFSLDQRNMRRSQRGSRSVASMMIVFSFCFSLSLCFSQSPLKLNFQFLNNSQDIWLNQTMQDLSGTAYKASDIAFYMSDLRITHDGGQVLDFGDSVFYVNIRASIFELGMQDVGQVESIAFNVGVPENLNHTDISAYPENHPMYFQTPPMHWGWTAGYTFFLINGAADSDGDHVPDAPFELHCLGDANLQMVEVPNALTIWEDGTKEIFQQVNIDQWLKGIDLKTLSAQHGSTGINAQAMQNVQDFPVFTAPQTASAETLTSYTGSMRFANNGNALEISWEAIPPMGRLEIYSADGKKAGAATQSGAQGKYVFTGLTAGAYTVIALSENGDVLHKINAVQP